MNSKKWNRVLTAAAAVSLAIGTMAPMAFAATGSQGTQYNTRTINVGQGYTAVVNGVVAQDQGHATEFLPIYYLDQGLGKLGYTVNWNGNTRTLNITTPAGVTVQAPTAAVGAPGATQMVIQLNGTPVQLAPRVVAKDPATGVYTTYAPIYYLDQALQLAGFTNTYDGTQGSWAVQGPAASQSTNAALGSLAITNQSGGDGSVTSPAVSLTGAAMTVTTTLKDASGNPIPNTAVTFNLSNYGSMPTLPTVENASGQIVSGQAASSNQAEQYTVYTDGTGTASISVTGPSGQTYAYEVVAVAPYAGANNTAVSSQPAYMEFVANNEAGLAPFAGSGTPYKAAIGSVVPISAILPPNASGQPEANVLITFTAAENGAAAFVSPTGTTLGTIIQVPTNSSGVATAYLSSATESAGTVSITGLPNGVNSPGSTYIAFEQAGVPGKIGNFSITQTSSSNPANIGTDVYVSGQLQDANGNPVPNGQILVTSPNSQSGNDFAYVSGSTTVDFPLVSSVTGGTLATSAYGDLVTADSAGNFSFDLTATRAATNAFHIYGVANGEVVGTAGVAATDLLPVASDGTVYFGQSTTLADISIGAFDQYVQNNSDTTLSGITAAADNGVGTAITNPAQVATMYFEPQNSAGKRGPLANVSLNYSISATNGGQIYSINGHELTSPTSAVSLQYTPTVSSTGTVTGATFTVGGVSVGTLTGNSAVTGAPYEDFSVGLINSNPGATTLTVQSGSVQSTATVLYGGMSPAQVATFSPGSAMVNPGGSQVVTYNVQDVNGNPVPNTAVTITSDGSSSDPFWITAVNGVTLQESLNMATSTTDTASYATEAVPIPLGAVPGTSSADTALDYNVSIPGVATWNYTSPTSVTLTSDSSGNVSMTLQAGNLSYPVIASSTVGEDANPGVPVALPSTSGLLGFYSNINGSEVPLYVYTYPNATTALSGTLSTPSALTTIAGGTTGGQGPASLQGQIGW